MRKATAEHPLRKWRKAEGLTLQEAAEKVGTSRQVWSDWERGRRRPNQHFMPRVRNVTEGKVSADDFFCGEPRPAPLNEAA
jgi:transcriptional regulator with XRE-family HTH domain